MSFIQDAKLKAGVWWRERKERTEERKRVRALSDGKEIGFDRNPRRIRFAVLLATYGVLGFLILWVAQTVGDVRFFIDVGWKLGEMPRFAYDVAFAGDILSLIVLSVVSFAIVLYSKAWVSYFMDTPWSEWGSKMLSFVLGVGGSAAIIMGGLEVNQHIRQEDYRGALVEEQSATQGRAAIQAQIASIDQRLASMRDQSNVGVYAAIAASVGTVAYDSDYLSDEAMARTDPSRRDLVRRARGAAVAADALEAQKLTLAGQLAVATPEAATAATVEMTDPVSNFINGLGPWRIVLLVLVGDLILLFGTYLADKREERIRYASSSAASGWADESHRIEDMREDEPVVPQPMKPAREVVTDAETGEELIKITPKPHWRKAKGKKQKVETQPDVPPDETGVTNDGGNRTGMTVAGPIDLDALAPQTETPVDEATEEVAAVEEALPDLSDEELAVLPELSDDATGDSAIDSANAEPEQDAGADDDSQHDHAERTEPETDERRMIAAE